MSRIETVTLVSDRSGDFEQRIELSVGTHGVCEITLRPVGGDGAAHLSVPCSLSNLQMVARGLSYQSSSSNGHVRLEWTAQGLQLQLKCAGDDRYWNYRVPIERFRDAVESIDRSVPKPVTEAYLS